MTAACLENMATEVRNLQRTEIGEVGEPFMEGDQIGSSAMPHKRNPVRCETVCSLGRLVRGLVGPALENVVTWHERDLANSANERFTLPQVCVLVEHMLTTMTRVVAGLRVSPGRMAENLARSRHTYLSERVLLLLVERGMERLTAYRLVQEASGSASRQDTDMLSVLRADPRLQPFLDSDLSLLTTGVDTGFCRDIAAETTERALALLKEVPR
jgi:adenylosuccinate lyase